MPDSDSLNKHDKHGKHGFTLVEAIVVAVIVAILAAVAIPLYTGYVRDSRAKVAETSPVPWPAHAAGSRRSILQRFRTGGLVPEALSRCLVRMMPTVKLSVSRTDSRS